MLSTYSWLTVYGLPVSYWRTISKVNHAKQSLAHLIKSISLRFISKRTAVSKGLTFKFLNNIPKPWTSLVAQMVKNPPAMQETWVSSLEKKMAIHSGVLAWRIPRTEEPDGLQSSGSQGVGHNWVTNTHTHSLKLCWFTFPTSHLWTYTLPHTF